MQGNIIKRQFEEIIKDTKILCELEPFVKKWSFNEISPHFEITNAISPENRQTLTEILRDVKPLTICDDDLDAKHKREKLLRELKGIMMVPASNDDDNGRNNSVTSENPIEEDQYDHELEKTLKALQEIENVDAVTQADIDDFIRGLGGKPDGVDLTRINIREWKDIFMEHWLDLYNLSMKSTLVNKRRDAVKHQGILPNITRAKSPIKKDRREDVVRSQKSADRFSVCTSSRVNLDSHFMTREERKNMATSFKLHGAAQGESTKNGLQSTSSPYLFSEYQRGVVPVEREKSLLTLRKEHHETLVPHMQEKTASSAFIGISQPQYTKNMSINDLKASTDNFYGDRERQTKKIAQNNCLNETKFKAELAKNSRKDRNTGQIPSFKGRKVQASVRPSSAIPVYDPIPLTGGVSKFAVVKGKIR